MLPRLGIMAFRIDEAVIRGEIDNTVEGRVTGRVWLLGREEPLVLNLEGDCWRDLAGTRLLFENPAPKPDPVVDRLLTDQTPEERRAKQLDRLKRYVGHAPGLTDTAKLEQQSYEQKLANGQQQQPNNLEIERADANLETYVIGDRDLYSITFTPRAGANFSTGVLGEGVVWIGGMYMDFAQEIRDSLRLADINPRLPILVGQDELNFSVRIKAKNPWNLLLGGSWQLNKRWSIALELGGVLDRFQVTTAAMFRF